MIARLSDDPLTLNFGVGLLKFTEAEEAILSEAVPESEIRIKPSGQPYLSHPTYTRWANRAFGRGQWHMRPLAKPSKAGNSVVVPYALMVRGVPVATAYGEQEYFDTNRDQTYGDALESTVASALRRCLKRLGVGLEMWDREYLNRFMDRWAIAVKVEGKDGKLRRQWRLKTDPPLPYERGVARLSDDVEEAQRQQTRRRPPAPPAPPRAEPPASTNPKEDHPITDAMVQRFWTIARRSGRSDDEVKRFLKEQYQLGSSKEIKRKDYENICVAVEHPGPLQVVLDIVREPGEDG